MRDVRKWTEAYKTAAPPVCRWCSARGMWVRRTRVASRAELRCVNCGALWLVNPEQGWRVLLITTEPRGGVPAYARKWIPGEAA